MQIVNTKLPNENIQTYQPQMIDSGGGGRGVNYQMQIVIKLPNGTTKVAQNDSEQPVLPNSQLFLSFPTEVVQNDSEQPILPNSQLFQSFPTEVAQNDLEQPNLPDSQLFQSFPTKVAQNDSEQPILPDLQLFQSFPTKVDQNSQFHLIHNFANLSPSEWLRMTQKGQFCLICNFSNLFPPDDRLIDPGGGGVNDQMQIVNTKLPNENIQTYQPQMINSRGGGKLPNTNCDQTTKWYHQSGSE